MKNDVLSALPTYTMCTYLLSKTMIKQIDKYRKHCLWRGSDIHSKKAAWKLVCNSKDNGGLGVHDLYVQNESLLLKHLHKFFNKCDIPWVHLVWNAHYGSDTIPTNNRKGSFWWRDICKLLESFKGMASVTIGDGSTCLFWMDVQQGTPLNTHWPHLFSFVKDDHISAHQFLTAVDKSKFFHIPLSVEAHDHYQLMVMELDNFQVTNSNETWSYIWGSSVFASSKAYSHLLGIIPVPPIYKMVMEF
jgi:hypothetical protein